ELMGKRGIPRLRCEGACEGCGLEPAETVRHARMSTPGEDAAALARLERRLARERSARLEAEAIAERGLRDLYAKQRQIELLQGITVAANEAVNAEQAIRTA